MRDFACLKNKSKKSKKKRRARSKTQSKTRSTVRSTNVKTVRKKRTHKNKQPNYSWWQTLALSVKHLANFIAIAVILLLGFYFGLESVINYFFPLEKTENILLVFVNKSNSKTNFYFFSTKAKTKQFSLSLIESSAQDSDLESLNALQWSGKLKVMVDRVERFDFFVDLDDDQFYGSLQKMRKLFFHLIKNEVKDQSSSAVDKWQKIKQLIQWRAVLAEYQFYGDTKTAQNVTLDELPSFILGYDNQNCSLGVLNATAIPGLASQTSKILEQAGFLILRISNADRDEYADNKLDITQLVVKQNLSNDCQEIQDRLLNWLPEGTIQTNNEQLLNRYRNDLILLLGEDMALELFSSK